MPARVIPRPTGELCSTGERRRTVISTMFARTQTSTTKIQYRDVRLSRLPATVEVKSSISRMRARRLRHKSWIHMEETNPTFPVQGMSRGTGYLPTNIFNLGWADAVMVYGSLRAIAISPYFIGLAEQRVKERLGFRLLL